MGSAMRALMTYEVDVVVHLPDLHGGIEETTWHEMVEAADMNLAIQEGTRRAEEFADDMAFDEGKPARTYKAHVSGARLMGPRKCQPVKTSSGAEKVVVPFNQTFAPPAALKCPAHTLCKDVITLAASYKSVKLS